MEKTSKAVKDVIARPATAHDLPALAQRDFDKIHQGKATNELTKTKTTALSPEIINIYGDATIEDKERGFKLFISKYNELTSGVRVTAKMLLDALTITATESGQHDTLVKLPLKEYMERRGLKDVKTARTQVKEDIEALERLHLEFRDTSKARGKQGDYIKVNIGGGTSGISRGVILFRFNEDFFNILMSYPVMPYPKEALTFNVKHNPNSHYFLRQVSEHKNMNYHKPNADIIGVKTLLNSSPDMPRYEDIKDIGGVQQRIIDRFERDMDAIQSFKWHYCGKNGAKIDPPTSYDEFIEARVKIGWINYPERERKRTSKKKKDASGEA